MQKKYEITLDIYETRNYSHLVFGQYDKGNVIEISFTQKTLPLSLRDITALVKLNDSYQLHGVNREDILVVELPQSALSVLGQNQLTVSLYDANDNVVTVQRVYYTVREGMGKLTELTEDPTLGQQIVSDMAAFQAAENARNEAEALRLSCEEERKTAETERRTKEELRSEGERQRVSSEENRNQSEQLRREAEAKRVEADSERAVFDAACESNESARVAMEQERLAQESLRIAGETAREAAEAERANAEESRLREENSRRFAEIERVRAEQLRQEKEAERNENELLRNENEEARQETYEAWKATAESEQAAWRETTEAEQAAWRETTEAEQAQWETFQSTAETAEAERNTAEAERKTAEAERIANEAQRQATYRENRESYANIIKDTVSGEIVRMDDVSPLEHEMRVAVESKNLLDSTGFYYNTLANGTTTTRLEDGGLHIQGELTGLVFVHIRNSFTLPKGTYTYSIITDTPNMYAGVFHYDDAGNMTILCDTKRTVTFESDGTGKFLFQFRTFQSGALDNTVYCMLEKGVNTSPTYTKYVPDVSAVTLTRCGKNLLKGNRNETYNGITYTTDEDGVVTVNGTATNMANRYVARYTVQKNGTYTFSGAPTNSSKSTYYISVMHSAGDGRKLNGENTFIYYTDLGKGVTFDCVEGDEIEAYGIVASGVAVTNVVFKPQLELGTVKTDFEPYQGEVFTPNTDGTVEGVTSISPTTTLIADTSGVLVNCTYNKDTKTYIDEKFAALQALLLEV